MSIFVHAIFIYSYIWEHDDTVLERFQIAEAELSIMNMYADS